MASLITLIYVSTAAHPMSEAELGDLLVESRENNQRLGVTGMLLYRDGVFLQALEGEKVTVNDLYARIREDPRHKHVLLINEHEVDERVFPDWSMGFQVVTDDDLSDIEGFTDYLSSSRETSGFTNYPDLVTRLLHRFRS